MSAARTSIILFALLTSACTTAQVTVTPANFHTAGMVVSIIERDILPPLPPHPTLEHFDLDEYLDNYDQFLDQLWEDPSLSAAERKQIVFELWDECLDMTPQPTWRELGADAVRMRIEASIRRQAERSTQLRYTPEDLERFNESRLSEQPFAPYLERD